MAKQINVVTQINTILCDVVEKPVNVLLYGILAAFDDEISVQINARKDGTIEVIVDEEPNIGLRVDWTEIKSDKDVRKMLKDSYIAAFQLKELDLNKGICQLQEYIKGVNAQLSTDEKRHFAEIIDNVRTLQTMLDDLKDILCKNVDLYFENIDDSIIEPYEEHGKEMGYFLIDYYDGVRSESITVVDVPLEECENLLDVYTLNPDYYTLLAGNMWTLISSVVKWWGMTSGVVN